MGRHGLVAGALLLLTVLPAGAQLRALPSPNPPCTPLELEAAARALHDHPDQFRQAASLYMEAAMLRAAADPQAVQNRILAARLLHYSGDHAHAQAVMEDAAASALAAGDIVTAAHALLDAAWLANRQTRTSDVVRLAERAELLMASPLVDESVRRAVLVRIERRGGRVSVRQASP